MARIAAKLLAIASYALMSAVGMALVRLENVSAILVGEVKDAISRKELPVLKIATNKVYAIMTGNVIATLALVAEIALPQCHVQKAARLMASASMDAAFANQDILG